MDFKDQIKQVADRIEALKANLQTEEATKTALIMPFISALGYDVFNPLEVLPEMNCDIGTKKGEKIDYAIIKNGDPIILIECKHWAQDLNLHDNQLIRYFNVSSAKFGILTNGIIYRFYTDLAEPNKMDEKPFFEINLLELKDAQIEELKKFHRSYFDIETILSSASELKYVGELKNVIGKEFVNPSPEFVKFIAKQVYEGVFTQKVLEQFSLLVKRTISNYISDMISDRLKAAIKDTTEEAKEIENPTIVPVVEENKIVTTEEEMEGFYIIKSILRETIPAERITYRDAQSYFAVFIDDNNRKPVCRLYLNSPTNKRVAIMDENKKEIVYKISSIDEIYLHGEGLKTAALRYL
ncbi:MAG: type I restriction enzyme HsdR N-terminal domain-containing protein [Alistipes sp.]|nr:type I restriction enzyme HsdR N-terminal domain-containing protein [Alistipes sp.]